MKYVWLMRPLGKMELKCLPDGAQVWRICRPRENLFTYPPPELRAHTVQFHYDKYKPSGTEYQRLPVWTIDGEPFPGDTVTVYLDGGRSA